MLAIVPARGGSKELPGKNVKSFCGKPLIEYTLQAARQCVGISRLVVSTDSKEIARIAQKAGAEVPFLRPARLAGDNSLAMDTYLYTCERLANEGNEVIKNFVVLQPTSPLRTAEDIEGAIRLFKKKKADSVISVTESAHPVEWHKRVDKNGVLMHNLINGASGLKNRQGFNKTYLPNGAIYVFNLDFLKRKRSYYSAKTFAYLMPRERSVDIDSLIDFRLAEILVNHRGVN